jgi:hypothetical protein
MHSLKCISNSGELNLVFLEIFFALSNNLSHIAMTINYFNLIINVSHHFNKTTI